MAQAQLPAMENLGVSERPGSGGNQEAAQSLGVPPPQQLPPQMFTTAAQLLDLTDSECAAVLGWCRLREGAGHEDALHCIAGRRNEMRGLG